MNMNEEETGKTLDRIESVYVLVFFAKKWELTSQMKTPFKGSALVF